MTSMRYCFLLATAACFLAGAGCAKPVAGTAEKAAQPVFVTVANPLKKSIHWQVEQPATIQAFETTPIVAKIPGYVSRVLVDMDDRVEGPKLGSNGEETSPGTLLAELSIPELDEESQQKQAMAEQSRVEVDVARSNVAVAAANVKSAETFVLEMEAGLRRTDANNQRWKSEANRADEMVSRRVMDKQTAEETRSQAVGALSEYEESKAKIVSAQAKLAESRAKELQAKSEVLAAQSRVAATAAEVRRIAALKKYTRITAPFAGVVTARSVHTGHFLPMNSMQPLFVVARLDPVRVFMDVPESAAGRVQRDSEARVKIPSLKNGDIAGKITRTSWALNPDMRTLRVEIDLPNADGRIRPGMFSTVVLPIENRESLTVPVAAIQVQDELNYCYIVEAGKALRVQADLGVKEGDVVELKAIRKPEPKSPWQTVTGDEKIVVKYEGPITSGEAVQLK